MPFSVELKENIKYFLDNCNESSVVDELEVLSLVEEHIPRYKLRFDTITQFSGYVNNNYNNCYIKTPLISTETPLDLSPETLSETLKYFVLSSERLSQMTKTYNDIEAVTKLLEEKERDLELAARIGQSLLDQNKVLSTRNEELESELSSSHEVAEKLKFEIINNNERVIQLKHELSMKNGLLQVYSADIEAEELESEEPIHSSEEKTSILTNWEELHQRVGNLEEENLRLKIEANIRANDIELEERKELQLIHDCAKQLTAANLQILNFQEEVGRKNEDNIRQQEEITNLLTQVVDLQRKVRHLTIESESLEKALNISHECQNELSLELIEIKEKYGTLLAAFHELQIEFKKRSRLNSSHYTFMPFSESLASEIESSLGSDGSEGDSGTFVRQKKKSLNTKEELRSHSPDSVLSGDSLYYRYNNPQPVIGLSQKNYYFPADKLQIVKPLEGSATLRQWQKLATPHLGVILESLPGVPNKAIKDLNKELLEFTLNSAKDCINCRNNFVTTNSIFTFTTTSLSQTTDSTKVTNTFSNVQLSTGLHSPIATTSCVNIFSNSLSQISGESIENNTTLLSKPNDNIKDKMISAFNDIPRSSLGLDSIISDESKVKDKNSKELLTDFEIKNPSESDSNLSHNNHNNNNETITSFNNSSNLPILKHSVNTTNMFGKGLGGMSSLLDKRSSDGVIMKCNSLLLRSKQKPNSLSIKPQDVNHSQNSQIADFSVIKTLRKGGFV